MEISEKIRRVEYYRNRSLECGDFNMYVKDFIKNIYEEVHNSNAIEGNTMTLDDTKKLLHGIAVHDYSHRDISETEDLYKAYIEMFGYTEEDLSEDLIRDTNTIILKNSQPSKAGVYRNYNVGTKSQGSIYSDWTVVPDETEYLIESFYTKGYHDLERVANLKGDFIVTHPFGDGNGRTSRLLMNWALIKFGYIPITIYASDKEKYIEVMNDCRVNKNNDYLLDYMCDILIKQYKKMLQY